MTILLKRPFAILDIESTGVNLATDRIIEISILKIMPDGSQHWYEQRINPQIPIPQAATEVHHISDADVADCPTFAQVSNSILQFLQNCDIGGYNSNYFDIPMLKEEFLRLNVNFDDADRQYVDVFRIFQKMEPRNLAAAVRFYCNKELENAHSARADVQATYDVLVQQLQRYSHDLQPNVDFLHQFTTDGPAYVDSGKRMIKENGIVKFNFGKHRGKPVEDVLRQEPQYYDWIMNNDFLLDTKQKLTEIWLGMKFRLKK